jgi:DNA-directed RNA polymerase specialized sigma24 family protein
MRRGQGVSTSLRRALFRVLATLPAGQCRVAMALTADRSGRTYPAVAAELGVHLGTVHQQLRRIRHQRPEIYADLMKERARQLATRHRRAVARARAHSKEWHEITKYWPKHPFGR